MAVKEITRRGNIDPDRWHRLKNILADALEQPSAADRAALVESRCGDDVTLLAEAESLIAEAERFLHEPTDSLEECAEHATSLLWSDESREQGRRIGAYVVVRELGRGGMGTVYLADRADGQFEKQVAIKVLKRGTDTDEVLRRFASERHILARLDHPNIARLLDAGTTDDGLPYFVMEYVAGVPVTRFVSEGRLSIDERLDVFLKVCAAVEVAHRSHVIHRDLKPSNILVNSDGEPKLLDFGIAKLLTPGEDDVDLTSATERRLTPTCASPEQADGRAVTEASDVYALGALLYELLTARRPYKFASAHPSREEVARVVRENEPPYPSAVAGEETARALRGDLDAIVMFALRKEPECRYATVQAFADDVRRHIAHEPVLARRHTAAYRMKCMAARYRRRAPMFAVAAVIVAVVAIAVGLITQRERATNATASQLQQTAPAATANSIAVLPFDSLGNDASPSYLADGVQDNILTDLGKIRGLKVISRSGVAAFRGKARDMQEIGRQLGVANVLEGTVQISGDHVRINTRLIDARTNAQVWAEHYDRKVEDIFALQSELAQTIAAQLNTTLSPPEKAAISKRPTDDMQAYDLYLRARAKMEVVGGGLRANQPQHWREMVDLLQAATERDPKFVLAYCLLSDAHLSIYRYGEDHTPERLAAAKEATDAAMRLDPESEEVRLASARYYYRGLSDYRRTQEELSKIPASGAHSIDFYTIAGLVQRRLALWDDAIRNMAKAAELDPQATSLAFNLVQTLTGVRRFEESERAANAAIMRLPATASDSLWMLKSEMEVARGNLEGARAALDSVHLKQGMDYDVARIWLSLLARDLVAARALANRAEPGTRSTPSFWVVVGTVARAQGDQVAAEQAFAEAERIARASLVTRSGDAELLGELATAEAGLGRNEEALRDARQAAEIMPLSADALAAPMVQARLSEVLAWSGDHDGALRVLGECAPLPFGPSYGDLKLNPLWDDLRSDARYDRILAETDPARLSSSGLPLSR